MRIVITLGNRMNDDGTITSIMKKRLDLTLELIEELEVDYIIVSGGIANPQAGVSEACKMREYLEKCGVRSNMIIEENQSHTTYENALFSVPIALSLNADEIIICTSIEHFASQPYNVIDYFYQVIKPHKVRLLTYTEC